MAPRWSGLGLNPTSSSERGEVASESWPGSSVEESTLVDGRKLAQDKADRHVDSVGDRVTSVGHVANEIVEAEGRWYPSHR